jgi:large subunit ribosomal protein L4
MELNVLDIKGSETGRKVKLSDELFGSAPNDHAIYLDVKQYLANKRQGTHKTKGRAEIARTTKKLKRQKGTGGARAGSMSLLSSVEVVVCLALSPGITASS